MLLPFDDQVIEKISGFDTACGSTLESIPAIAERFPNLIPKENYHLIYQECQEWIFDHKKLAEIRASLINEVYYLPKRHSDF